MFLLQFKVLVVLPALGMQKTQILEMTDKNI